MYLCHPHHRSVSYKGKKSQWAVSRPTECHIFCQVEASGDPSSPGVWFVSKGAAQILGQAEERLAYFERPATGGAWHGYPVGGTRNSGVVRYPPREVVEYWQSSERIPRHVADKIRRGRI